MNSMNHDDFYTLVKRYGMDTGYTNIWGEYQNAPDETLIHILNTLGVSVNDAQDKTAILRALQQFDDQRLNQILEPVLVVRESDHPIKVRVRLPKQDTSCAIQWELTEEVSESTEKATIHQGTFIQDDLQWQTSGTLADGTVIDEYDWEVPVALPWGYHLLSFFKTPEGKKEPMAEMALIMVPNQCYSPDALERGSRVWGPAVQLYAFRSKRNWGMGDFTDLKNVVSWCSQNGSGIVGLNPLHEMFPHQSRHISPYSPSTRLFLNTLYLDIEAMDDFNECKDIQDKVQSEPFQSRLARLREQDMVDYAQVAEIKRPLMEQLFAHFEKEHLNQKTQRGKAFQQFLQEQGRPLYQLALFQALQAFRYKNDMHQWAWQSWGDDFASPLAKGVKAFEANETHQKQIQYYLYLQWQAHLQLSEAKNEAKALNMPAGLYLDLAVGSDISGAEVWTDSELFALNMNVGCPPDECNQKGQDWGLPPMIPSQLRERAYTPFIRILRQNMAYAGALRLDHVMGLMRLFWIPKGQPGTNGTYVQYPFDDLLGILALESHRNQCIIIGENLGTVPERVQEKMDEWGILSYKVFLFERYALGTFKPAKDYPKEALVALSTHDLPTIQGFWASEDIRIREQLNLYPNDEFRVAQINNRVDERQGVLELLQQENLLPESLKGQLAESIPDISPELVLALHEFLARTPCSVFMVQLEDLFDQRKQINLPGTVDEYPNWQRKVMADLEDWSSDPRMQKLLEKMKQAYGSLVQTS